MSDIKQGLEGCDYSTKTIGNILLSYYEDMKSLETNELRGGKQATLTVMVVNDLQDLLPSLDESDSFRNKNFYLKRILKDLVGYDFNDAECDLVKKALSIDDSYESANSFQLYGLNKVVELNKTFDQYKQIKGK